MLWCLPNEREALIPAKWKGGFHDWKVKGVLWCLPNEREALITSKLKGGVEDCQVEGRC